MFAKTVCKPGSYICAVPIGLLTTLHYNSNGILDKVYLRYHELAEDKSAEMLPSCRALPSVPVRIKSTGGTTEVLGVLYTSTHPTSPGLLPMCAESALLDSLNDDPSQFTFYAGAVESKAAAISGFLATSNWMKLTGFTMLPSHLVFAGISDKGFNDLLSSHNAPFQYPLFSGFWIYDSAPRFHRLCFRQHVAESVADYVEPSGKFMTAVLTDSGEALSLDRSTACTFGLANSSVFITDSSDSIIYSGTSQYGDNIVTCPHCGNRFSIKSSGETYCPEISCTSHLISWFNQFASSVDLPQMDSAQLSELIERGTVTCFADMFLLPEYESAHVEVSLYSFLRAFVPTSVCPRDAVLTSLATLSGNAKETLMYYLNNTSKLQTELADGTPSCNSLIEWITDPYIVCTIKTLLDSSQFIVNQDGSIFDGPQIFRNKTIAITGTFRRGSSQYISRVLRSYGATATLGVTGGEADCLVIGSLNEQNDGRSIQYAKSHGILIYSEDAFFANFDIDADLKARLLD